MSKRRYPNKHSEMEDAARKGPRAWVFFAGLSLLGVGALGLIAFFITLGIYHGMERIPTMIMMSLPIALLPGVALLSMGLEYKRRYLYALAWLEEYDTMLADDADNALQDIALTEEDEETIQGYRDLCEQGLLTKAEYTKIIQRYFLDNKNNR